MVNDNFLGRFEFGEYWNPMNETMPREQLEKLQLAKLQRIVSYAYEKSAFHRRKFEAAGFHPDQLHSLADLDRIPFTTKDEWLEEQKRYPMFGEMLTAPQELATRYHATSGTSGRTPLRVLDGRKDWQWAAEMWAYSLYAFGIRSHDIVYYAFGYGSFIGFWGSHYGSEKIGALTIASGGMSTEARVKQLIELGATTLCATPTYVLRMAQVARDMGIDVARESKINKVVVTGEPGGNVPATRKMIAESWGAEVSDIVGMTESGSCFAFECRHHPGGTHIMEDHVLEETLDPKTGERLGYGERGERIFTSFGRGFIPLIRFRTGDLVVRVPGSTCTCGRTWDIYQGGILGRVDDMKLIRGTNVYPSSIEAVVRKFEEVDEFQIVITRENGIMDEITVEIELSREAEERFTVVSVQLAKDLADAHENLRFNITQADCGSLPRYELKARRMKDLRGI